MHAASWVTSVSCCSAIINLVTKSLVQWQMSALSRKTLRQGPVKSTQELELEELAKNPIVDEKWKVSENQRFNFLHWFYFWRWCQKRETATKIAACTKFCQFFSCSLVRYIKNNHQNCQKMEYLAFSRHSVFLHFIGHICFLRICVTTMKTKKKFCKTR